MAMQHYCPPTKPWVHCVFEDQDIIIVHKSSGPVWFVLKYKAHYDSMWSCLIDSHPDLSASPSFRYVYIWQYVVCQE